MRIFDIFRSPAPVSRTPPKPISLDLFALRVRNFLRAVGSLGFTPVSATLYPYDPGCPDGSKVAVYRVILSGSKFMVPEDSDALSRLAEKHGIFAFAATVLPQTGGRLSLVLLVAPDYADVPYPDDDSSVPEHVRRMVFSSEG